MSPCDRPPSSLPRKRESRRPAQDIGTNAWMPAFAGMTDERATGTNA